jgi:hypothetical protein
VTRCFALRSSALASLGLLVTGSARAASPQLSYQAPEGCPGQESFVAAVEARGASLEAGGLGAEPRLLSVLIERDSEGFSGTFRVGEGTAASGPRRVHAPTCGEVSEALAVVTAIALQSDAERTATPAAATTSLPEPVLAVEAARPEAAVALPPPPRPLQLVMGKDSVDVAAGKVEFGYLSGQTLRAGAAFGVIPNLTLPRIDFSLSHASVVTTPGDRDFLLGGVFRVRWSFLGVGTLRSQGFSTDVWGLKAGIGRCTPVLHDPQGLELKLCAEIAAGVMSAVTRDATGRETQDKLVGIGTAGVEVDASYNISSAFHVGMTLGGEMWPSKVSAERPDGSRLFESELFNAYALVGIGLRF